MDRASHTHPPTHPPFCVVQVLPVNSVFVNGARVALDGNTFNVYDLLAEVRALSRPLSHI